MDDPDASAFAIFSEIFCCELSRRAIGFEPDTVDVGATRCKAQKPRSSAATGFKNSLSWLCGNGSRQQNGLDPGAISLDELFVTHSPVEQITVHCLGCCHQRRVCF